MPDGVNIPGGPSFVGNPQPPDVPCDPTGDGWRGPPGPVGPAGIQGPPGTTTVVGGIPEAPTDGTIYGRQGSSTSWRGALPLTGGTMTGPLYWTATGATTSRSAQDRSAELPYSVKDFGAVLNGTANDSAAFQAASNATPDDGSIIVPRGGFNVLTAPTRSTGNVLWVLDGNHFGTGAVPVRNIGDGNVTEGYFAGHKTFSKFLGTSLNAFAIVEININNTNSAIAGFASGLVLTGTSTAGGTGGTWNLNSRLTSSGVGTNPQDTGIGSTIIRTGNAATWQWYSDTIDQTGVSPNHQSANIGMEMNIHANGPEDPSTSYDGALSARVHFHIQAKNYLPPAWQASHAYAVNTTVQPVTANGYTYVSTVGGTSAASAPTWPTTVGATVTDGTVTWQCGATVAMQVGHCISVGGEGQIGSLISTDATYYNAILAFDKAALSDGGVKDAGIRLAANMPIDFSGDGTAAGQNNHTLKYDSATQKLFYAVAGVNMWSVDASGNVRARGTVTGSTTP